MHKCDEFQFTTFNYCRKFYPLCTYSLRDFICTQLISFGDSKQINSQFTQYQCWLTRKPDECIFQRLKPCLLYYKVACSNVDQTRDQCEFWDDEKFPSTLYCEEVPDCKLAITSYGQPFCYLSKLTCENISPNLCLREIPDIYCYIKQVDGMNSCSTFQDKITCDSIQGLKVNYSLCLKASNNSGQSCFYSAKYNLCKKVISTTNQDISLKDCNNSLNSQFYNLKQQKCANFNNTVNYDDIYFCFQLNQIACKSSVNKLQCVWIDDKCEEDESGDYEIKCSQKNYKACLNANQDCIWNLDNKICQDQLSMCISCEYSEYHCISKNQLWDGKNCYLFQNDVPASFFRCDNLGLNMDLCLNNTVDLYCYWNGFKCKESNLKMLKCTDTVSKSTCLKIKTFGQICKWTNNQCVNVINSQNCNDYLNLQNCRDSKVSCEYNLGQNQCQQKVNNLQFCLNTLSYGACRQVKYQYCQWDENQCQQWNSRRYSCDNIINYWGCMNTMMFCKWEDERCLNIESKYFIQDKVSCYDIPQNYNKASCSKYSIGPCRYDENIQKCDINLTSDDTDSLSIDQADYTQIRLIYECTQFTDVNDCQGSRIGYCEWKDDKCLNCEQNQNCSNEGCYNKSLKQCLYMSNQLCAWRNDSCVEWIINPEANLQELILVTEKCCSVLNIEIKYDVKLQSCSSIDYEVDDCSTPGLSEYACLRIVKFECVFVNDKCSEFKLGAQENCEQYYNVTQAVCQNLQHLSCKYDSQNHKCIGLKDFDTSNSLGLSILGCSNIKSTPCYWDNDSASCQDFIVDPGQNQCDDVTIRNSLSCSQLNYHLDFCSFNIEKRTCHKKFNPNSKCSYPGLNQLACVNLTIEPCIYKNNQCQKISNLYVSCNDMKNVNVMACKLNLLDNCSYDPIYHNCVFTLSALPCNHQGMNLNNCANQSTCQWSYDDSQCVCKSDKTLQKCKLEVTECKNNYLCAYDRENLQCKLKTCSNLTICKGLVNGYVCYMNQQQQCQNAKNCEDIINLDRNSRCDDFVFNFSNCITLQGTCISSTNLESICAYSDCSSTSCRLDNFVCRPSQCSDYSDSECFQQQNCAFLSDKCQYIESCSKINDRENCVKTTVRNKRCSWEIYGIFENTQHCTNTYCSLYMVSPSMCNGNEVNQYSCFMDQFLQCRQCEEIVDRCTCENSNGACIYSEDQCKSILCQIFLNEKDCVASKKCYWSKLDKVCRKYCKQLILEEDCDALSYECHWNPYQYQCEQGVQIIPDLSVKIDIYEIEYSQIIVALFIIYLE